MVCVLELTRQATEVLMGATDNWLCPHGTPRCTSVKECNRLTLHIYSTRQEPGAYHALALRLERLRADDEARAMSVAMAAYRRDRQRDGKFRKA